MFVARNSCSVDETRSSNTSKLRHSLQQDEEGLRDLVFHHDASPAGHGHDDDDDVDDDDDDDDDVPPWWVLHRQATGTTRPQARALHRCFPSHSSSGNHIHRLYYTHKDSPNTKKDKHVSSQRQALYCCFPSYSTPINHIHIVIVISGIKFLFENILMWTIFNGHFCHIYHYFVSPPTS